MLLRRLTTIGFAAALISATVLTTAATSAQAAPTSVTSYSFASEAGDYIGSGQTRAYQAPSADIQLSGTAGHVTMRVEAGSEWWRVELAAPNGDVLRPGRYLDAERAAFRTGRSPGLDVSGTGRGCNQVYGNFWIDQIGVAADGTVTMLDARFIQQCESETAPRLQGTVKFAAYPLSYRFVSDAGDYVGGGTTKSYTNATSVFDLRGDANGVSYSVSGQRDDWTVDLYPPAGETLRVGTYTGAQRYPFNDAGRPGLSVSGNGRGCSTLTGQFTIQEIAFDASGEVIALFATYEQHCEGGTPALRGTIRYFA
ncbi:hypothetical protein BDK92_6638 [Micromonospora pisi]|uniref:Uncharacterized protein n=1 Tax=Micromonospora pisi TaxID=589240 RepID=A0A495JV56_9ACTN|nr:hypothetical protein [Micromonospora pisi]RKR92204.1 hypothetical protein BDK92_6638 [Micromonospora pisi]